MRLDGRNDVRAAGLANTGTILQMNTCFCSFKARGPAGRKGSGGGRGDGGLTHESMHCGVCFVRLIGVD